MGLYHGLLKSGSYGPLKDKICKKFIGQESAQINNLAPVYKLANGARRKLGLGQAQYSSLKCKGLKKIERSSLECGEFIHRS